MRAPAHREVARGGEAGAAHASGVVATVHTHLNSKRAALHGNMAAAREAACAVHLGGVAAQVHTAGYRLGEGRTPARIVARHELQWWFAHVKSFPQRAEVA